MKGVELNLGVFVERGARLPYLGDAKRNQAETSSWELTSPSFRDLQAFYRHASF